MDTLTLRILIIVTGILVMAAMVAWSWYKKYSNGENSLSSLDPGLSLHPEYDDYEIIPVNKTAAEHTNRSDGSDQTEMPELIQLHLAAPEHSWFQGPDLVSAFERLGLTYTELKIYQRQTPDGQIDFSLACMINPGTFPDNQNDIATFECPGLTLFMQPREIDDPAAIFEDMIAILDLLAIDLGGTKWDHSRQPLTLETLQDLRQRLY